jgi:hypothetical protein
MADDQNPRLEYVISAETILVTTRTARYLEQLCIRAEGEGNNALLRQLIDIQNVHAALLGQYTSCLAAANFGLSALKRYRDEAHDRAMAVMGAVPPQLGQAAHHNNNQQAVVDQHHAQARMYQQRSEVLRRETRQSEAEFRRTVNDLHRLAAVAVASVPPAPCKCLFDGWQSAALLDDEFLTKS